MRWFEATHDVTIGFGVARWTRTALPGPGSVGAQDARLMEALELLKRVQNELLITTKSKPNA